MFNLVFDGLKDPMKQTNAHDTKFKYPQNEIRLNSKPIPRGKRNRTREKH